MAKKLILEKLGSPSQQLISMFKAGTPDYEDVPLHVGVKNPPAVAGKPPSTAVSAPRATPTISAKPQTTGINSPTLMESRHIRRSDPQRANAYMQQTVSGLGHALHDASLHPVGSKGHHEPIIGTLGAIMQMRREVPREHYEAFAKEFQSVHPHHPLASALSASDSAIEQRQAQHVNAARNFNNLSEKEQQIHAAKGAELVQKLKAHHTLAKLGSTGHGGGVDIGFIPLPPGAKNHQEAENLYDERLKNFQAAAKPKEKEPAKEAPASNEKEQALKRGEKAAELPFWAQKLQQSKPKMHKQKVEEDEWEKSFAFNGITFYKSSRIVLERPRKR